VAPTRAHHLSDPPVLVPVLVPPCSAECSWGPRSRLQHTVPSPAGTRMLYTPQAFGEWIFPKLSPADVQLLSQASAVLRERLVPAYPQLCVCQASGGYMTDVDSEVSPLDKLMLIPRFQLQNTTPLTPAESLDETVLCPQLSLEGMLSHLERQEEQQEQASKKRRL